MNRTEFLFFFCQINKPHCFVKSRVQLWLYMLLLVEHKNPLGVHMKQLQLETKCIHKACIAVV